MELVELAIAMHHNDLYGYTHQVEAVLLSLVIGLLHLSVSMWK